MVSWVLDWFLWHVRNQSEYRFMFVNSSGSQLEKITTLIEKNDIKPSIDSAYGFDDVEILDDPYSA
ncbi:MAG TPA: hypothetical protein DEF35_04005 [Paenibacillus sp.]|nr:hypothetical protein CA599_12015 [Paenibacillus taichungensis]HBU80790.1 hypothetical protein [Paenibacillus sp.]